MGYRVHVLLKYMFPGHTLPRHYIPSRSFGFILRIEPCVTVSTPLNVLQKIVLFSEPSRRRPLQVHTHIRASQTHSNTPVLLLLLQQSTGHRF